MGWTSRLHRENQRGSIPLASTMDENSPEIFPFFYGGEPIYYRRDTFPDADSAIEAATYYFNSRFFSNYELFKIRIVYVNRIDFGIPVRTLVSREEYPSDIECWELDPNIDWDIWPSDEGWYSKQKKIENNLPL